MNLYDRANSISQQISVEMATCPASASGPGDDLESQGLLISSNNALTLRDERRSESAIKAGGKRKSRVILLLVAGASLLLIAGSFLAGASFGSDSRQTGCASSGTSAYAESGNNDGTSPEGPVSGNFDERYDFRGRPREVESKKGAVAADHGRCSEMGLGALKEGGNAVDAAVITALCQGIYNPMASGVGGGHLMIIRLPNGTVEVVDAREIAPLAANETMFKGRPEAALSGGLASAVPLELLGLFSVHTRHGKLPWASLVHPVADVAESGFAAHPYLVSALERMNFTEKSELRDLMETFYVQDKVLGTLRPPRVNETCCKRPALAAFLRLVAEQGPQVLYTGQYADEFAKDIQEAGGIITSKDLARAAVSIKQALKTNVFGLEFFVPPPPSSGAAVLSALHILAGWDLPLAGAGALGVHRTVEAMKHVFAIRASIGDPGPDSNKHKSFVPSLSEVLHDALSHKYTEKLREMVVDDDVLDMMSYGGKWNLKKAGVPPKDAGTSHLNAVDDLGMAVALTSTVNTGFGAKFISRSTGILLNNQMDDFSTPGQHNIYGLPPSVANFIVPGKKPLSSMSPMIVQQDGRLRAVLGASGGPRIISAVLQTLLRLFAYGEDLFSAVAGPRLHHQLVPDVLYAEDWTAGGLELHYKNETLTQLAARHHHVMPTVWGAVVQAITLNEKLTNTTMIKRSRILTAVSDPRKDGAPAAL